jgi:pyruvate dehydrogenase E2 component (dihydrolipoamide acetyltransferase)
MGVAVILPKLGLTMEEATLVKWHKEIGDTVETNEVVAEVETDKSTMEIEAASSGVLLDKLFEEGDIVPVSKVICHIGDVMPQATSEKKTEEVCGSGQGRFPTKVENRNNDQNFNGLRLSPAVRKKARMLGLTFDELKLIRGSGPRNRIVLNDLESFSTSQNNVLGKDQQVTINHPKKEKETILPIEDKEPLKETLSQDVIPLNRIRSVTARKLTASFREIPQFIIKKQVDLSNINKIKNTLKSIGVKISLNDFLIQAAAKALEKNELVNVYFSDSENELKIIKNKEVNIGLAVATDNGLLVPVIRKANQLSLAEISKKRETLIKNAKSNSLSRDELTGGTFTISNLGAFDVEEFTAIVNPPETAILAVGTTIKKPIVTQDDQIEIRPTLKMIASFDHRTLDGADAAKFMKDLGQLLETDQWEVI